MSWQDNEQDFEKAWGEFVIKRILEGIDLASEILKKGIPMESTLDICPVCEWDLKVWDDTPKYKHCPNCGQKLGLEAENEK